MNVLLTGANSFSKTGSITKYEWDIDWDGVPGNFNVDAIGVEVQVFIPDGNRTIGLKVTDQDGNTDYESIAFTSPGIGIRTNEGIKVISGGSIKLDPGGDIYLTDDASNPSEIRWRKASDTTKYWTQYKSQTSDALVFEHSGFSSNPYAIWGTASHLLGRYDIHLDSTGFFLIIDSSGSTHFLVNPNAIDSTSGADLEIQRTGAKLRLPPRSGTPEGNVPAPPGVLCTADISGTTKLFIKASGTGNTGWVVVGTQT